MEDHNVAKYRKDIDGIRAIAVGAVILYHSGLDLLSGGYVGVDIFFVISGYLITRIIYGEKLVGTFSIISFYERRIRRIIPALYVVLIASVIAAIFISTPDQAKDFSRSLIFTQLFSSNIFFWRELDYFAAASELRPLLHTWSLGVEEQFYILVPVFLAVVSRWQRNVVVAATLALLVVSLAISVWAVAVAPSGAFFLLPSRAWELLLGSVLAIGTVPHLSNRLLREGEALLGIVLVFGALFLLAPTSPFPGWAAIAPCLGTAMIIHAGERRKTIAGTLLSARPVVFVGLLSYSLYLWHWPVLAFARQLYGGVILPISWTIVLGGLIFFLSWVSWRWVEGPCRRKGSVLTGGRLLAAFGLVSAALLSVGALEAVGPGWPIDQAGYAKPDIRGIEDYSRYSCFLDVDQEPSEWSGVQDCTIRASSQVSGLQESTMLWGDSFAAQWRPGLGETLTPGHGTVIQVTAGGCPPVIGFDPGDRPQCQAFNEQAIELIARQDFSRVILAARWERYEGQLKIESLKETIEYLLSKDIKVFVINQSPLFTFISPYDWQYRHADRLPVLVDRGPLVEEISRLDITDIIEPRDFLCQDGICPFDADGKYIYFDEGHLSSFGSHLAALGLLERIFENRQDDFAE